jgi:hypothetical protein
MITDNNERIMECVEHLKDIKRILRESDKLELRVKIVQAKVNAALESLNEEEDYEKVHPISAYQIT